MSPLLPLTGVCLVFVFLLGPRQIFVESSEGK